MGHAKRLATETNNGEKQGTMRDKRHWKPNVKENVSIWRDWKEETKKKYPAWRTIFWRTSASISVTRWSPPTLTLSTPPQLGTWAESSHIETQRRRHRQTTGTWRETIKATTKPTSPQWRHRVLIAVLWGGSEKVGEPKRVSTTGWILVSTSRHRLGYTVLHASSERSKNTESDSLDD